MRKITKVESTIPTIKKRKKVAAYARVSMRTDIMLHSISAQVSYYNSLIQKNPDWEYAGVYSDEFISGTKIDKRSGFMRMIQDCEEGKIDIILTKSISRFSRNTIDLLETIRHLKLLGIEVHFEKENINSMSSDGELMLSILASFAQEESRSISENVKWGIRKRMQAGILFRHFSVYGYKWDGDKMVIVPEEAMVVKRIFQNFIDGKSRIETEREFAADGITTRNGYRWRDSNIKRVLVNITYTGNMLFQKEFIVDPISKHKKKNCGELPQYYVQNTHEAIIDKETFDYVQKEMARRKKLGFLANKSININCFTGKIKCEHCGANFVRSTLIHKAKFNNKGKVISWTCANKKKKGGRCPTKKLPDNILKQLCAEVLEIEEFNEDIFLKRVEKIIIPQHGTLIFQFKDGTTDTRQWSNADNKFIWTEEYRAYMSEFRRNNPRGKNASEFTGKIKCSACGCNFWHSANNSKIAPKGKYYYWSCSKRHDGCQTTVIREEVLKQMIADILEIEVYDVEEFEKEMDYISVIKKNTLEFHLKNGIIQYKEYNPFPRPKIK